MGWHTIEMALGVGRPLIRIITGRVKTYRILNWQLLMGEEIAIARID